MHSLTSDLFFGKLLESRNQVETTRAEYSTMVDVTTSL